MRLGRPFLALGSLATRAPLGAIVTLLACASGATRGAASESAATPAGAAAGSRATYVTSSCPLPAEMAGYPLTVALAPGQESAAVDSAWLAAWARAAALRWPVPSHRRAQLPEYHRVATRVLPDAPRWADDWQPGEGHRAVAEVIVRRASPDVALVIRQRSGDGLFDRSLAGIVDDPMPAAPTLPPLPPNAPDSVRLLLRFGIEPVSDSEAPVGVVRFARQQRPVRVVPGTLEVRGGPADRAVVAYDVDADGRVVPGSVAVLGASGATFGRAVEEGLLRARFTPAEGDCAPIRLTVIQSFGR